MQVFDEGETVFTTLNIAAHELDIPIDHLKDIIGTLFKA